MIFCLLMSKKSDWESLIFELLLKKVPIKAVKNQFLKFFSNKFFF